MKSELPSTITLGDLGDVVKIDISLIGSVRGYRIMDIARGERTQRYVSDLILAVAEGYTTPHEIDADWLEKNVCFANAMAACETVINKTTAKNEPSPAQTT